MMFDNASVIRSLTITREADGRFVAKNVTKVQGPVQRYQTSRTWWTNQVFYDETNLQSDGTLKYKFRIDNASKISFEKEPNTEEDYKYSEIKE